MLVSETQSTCQFCWGSSGTFYISFFIHSIIDLYELHHLDGLLYPVVYGLLGRMVCARLCLLRKVFVVSWFVHFVITRPKLLFCWHSVNEDCSLPLSLFLWRFSKIPCVSIWVSWPELTELVLSAAHSAHILFGINSDPFSLNRSLCAESCIKSGGSFKLCTWHEAGPRLGAANFGERRFSSAEQRQTRLAAALTASGSCFPCLWEWSYIGQCCWNDTTTVQLCASNSPPSHRWFSDGSVRKQGTHFLCHLWDFPISECHRSHKATIHRKAMQR